MFVYGYDMNVTYLKIVEENGRIKAIRFADHNWDKNVSEEEQKDETSVIQECAGQLYEYFSGQRQKFDIPLEPEGTDFQKKVWRALMNIPYGEVCSYKDIAESVGNAAASRAVGMANNRNPIPIIIPCHRVIGANGSLTGYGGGVDLKKKLLELEGYKLKDNY